MRSSMMIVVAGLFVLALGNRVGPGGTQGRTADTVSVGGPAQAQVGLAWNAVPCPKTGGHAQGLTFISHGAALGGGAATMILENNQADGGKVALCALEVPCTIAATDSAQTVPGACDESPHCEAGDIVHVEWTDEACVLGPPLGAGSGVMEAM